MNYKVYLDLCALLDHHTFTKAAKERGCLQPSMSRRVMAEEKKLETSLFDRHTQELTTAGNIYLRYGKKLQRIADRFSEWSAKNDLETYFDLKSFTYMRTIYQAGSLTRAAEILYISQPALTLFLNNLEEQLSMKLLIRSRGKCTLTKEGEDYLSFAEEALAIEAALHREIDNLLRKSARKIRISLSRQTGSLLFSRVVAHFLREYPDIQVDITEADTDKSRELLIKDAVDMAIMIVPNLHGGSLKYTLIYEEEMKIIMPLSWKNRYPGPVNLNDMDGERFIMSQSFTAFYHIASMVMDRYQFTPDVVCRVNLFRAMAIMAASGAGASFYPAHMAVDYCENCHVVSLDPPAKYYLVYAIHENTEYGPPMKRLMELLAEEGQR